MSFNFMAAVTSTVILELEKIKSVTVSIFFPIYLLRSDGTGCHNLGFLNFIVSLLAKCLKIDAVFLNPCVIFRLLSVNYSKYQLKLLLCNDD